MKKTAYKVISVIISISIVLSCSSFYIFAQGNTSPYSSDECQKIVSALNSMEPIKDKTDLSDVDFSEIKVSNTIKTYNYTNYGLVFNSDFVALKYNNKLVCWAIKCFDNQETYYQISTAYVDIISKTINNSTDFALVYDRNCCYLYTRTEIYNIGVFSVDVSDRSIINSIDDISYESTAELNNINVDYSLYSYHTRNLSTTKSANNAALLAAPINYECDVKFVSQNPPSNLCWAASIACIVNYKKGTSYTATQVAKKYYGNTNYNKGLEPGKQDDILKGTYGLSYTYKNQVPSDGIMLKNIKSKYPIYGSFKWSSGGKAGYHAVVIYGINVVGGYIYIMDPEFGFCSASATGSGYKYTSGYSGVQLSLSRATCRYWTV